MVDVVEARAAQHENPRGISISYKDNLKNL